MRRSAPASQYISAFRNPLMEEGDRGDGPRRPSSTRRSAAMSTSPHSERGTAGLSRRLGAGGRADRDAQLVPSQRDRRARAGRETAGADVDQGPLPAITVPTLVVWGMRTRRCCRPARGARRAGRRSAHGGGAGGRPFPAVGKPEPVIAAMRDFIAETGPAGERRFTALGGGGLSAPARAMPPAMSDVRPLPCPAPPPGSPPSRRSTSRRWKDAGRPLLHEFHHHRLGATIDGVEYADAEVEFFDDLVEGRRRAATSSTR